MRLRKWQPRGEDFSSSFGELWRTTNARISAIRVGHQHAHHRAIKGIRPKPTEVIKRFGYSNISKGLRRLEHLCEGQFSGTVRLVQTLPSALDVSPDVVRRAVEDTKRYFRETEEAAWRASGRSLGARKNWLPPRLTPLIIRARYNSGQIGDRRYSIIRLAARLIF
jgi:hypothetical protein